MIESTGGRIIGIAPFWQPVVWHEMATIWKHLLKHLSIVVGFLCVWNNSSKLCTGLREHLLVNLKQTEHNISFGVGFGVRLEKITLVTISRLERQ